MGAGADAGRLRGPGPLFLLGNSEDLALSASTTGRQLGGGEDDSYRSGGTTTEVCRAAPVEYEVGGRSYETLTFVPGECVPRGEAEPVTVRYDPDDPTTITPQPRQWILYGFVALAVLGFLATRRAATPAVARPHRTAVRGGRLARDVIRMVETGAPSV